MSTLFYVNFIFPWKDKGKELQMEGDTITYGQDEAVPGD